MDNIDFANATKKLVDINRKLKEFGLLIGVDIVVTCLFSNVIALAINIKTLLKNVLYLRPSHVFFVFEDISHIIFGGSLSSSAIISSSILDTHCCLESGELLSHVSFPDFFIRHNVSLLSFFENVYTVISFLIILFL